MYFQKMPNTLYLQFSNLLQYEVYQGWMQKIQKGVAWDTCQLNQYYVHSANRYT